MPLILEPRTVTVHAGEGGKLTFTWGWPEWQEPLPWGEPVSVLWCTECPIPDELSRDALADVFARIEAALRPRWDAWRIERIAAGDETVDRDGALALLDVSNSWLHEMIRQRKVPEALRYGGRRIWLKDELLLAKARIVAESTSDAQRVEQMRRVPVNRHGGKSKP